MKEEKFITMGVRVPVETHRKLAEISKKKDLNISQLARIAFNKVIAENSN